MTHRPTQLLPESDSGQASFDLEQDEQDLFGNAFIASGLDTTEADASASPPPQAVDRVQGQLQQLEQENPLARASNPDPVQEGEQRRTVMGVEIIGRDVSPTALEVCENIVQALVGRREDIQQRLAREKTQIIIIPRSVKQTDVAEFQSLRGQQTFDGRNWEDVRGSGGMRIPSGAWVIAVPEENLVDAGEGTDPYGGGYSVALHELAHTVHIKGITDDERERIEALYAQQQGGGGPFTEAYGGSDDHEYFAQCTNAFFSVNDRMGHNGPEWLRQNDADMYEFLVGLYGPPPGDQQQQQADGGS